MKNSRNILFFKKKNWHGSQAKENIMESGRKEKFETGDIFIDISISSLSSGEFLRPWILPGKLDCIGRDWDKIKPEIIAEVPLFTQRRKSMIT